VIIWEFILPRMFDLVLTLVGWPAQTPQCGRAVPQIYKAAPLSPAFGSFLSDFRVSAKTEEPENEEHDNHKADDIDNSIHDPVSFACMGHSLRQKYCRSRGRKTIWTCPGFVPLL
jgi:hypothetical protein